MLGVQKQVRQTTIRANLELERRFNEMKAEIERRRAERERLSKQK